MEIKRITKRANGTLQVATVNEIPTKTQQHFKDLVNINNIMKKFKKTGQITHLNSKTGVYADMQEIPDLASALNTVKKAEEAFNALPSELRKKFGHDPENLINYLKDEKNIEESIELGLRVRVEQQPSLAQEIASAMNNIQQESKSEAKT